MRGGNFSAFAVSLVCFYSTLCNTLYKHMQLIVSNRENTIPPRNTKFIVLCKTLMVPELQGHILYFFTFLLGKVPHFGSGNLQNALQC